MEIYNPPTEGLIMMCYYSVILNVLKISDIVRKYQLHYLTLLKMNCEVCEYEFFKHINKETLLILDNIILEYHDRHKFIRELLNREGFR